ncbi:MAG: Holliday junction resolvase RecU [Carnobacterium sp.]|uniref:Holliday junction resolvase RecU n=1 Tax=Carnobacterium sp. TaxID=48221 RepID=UPI002FC8EF4A
MTKTYSRSHANRGAKLEMLVEMTNKKYSSALIASINKVPTPVKIKKVTGKDVEGVKAKGEWVDYVGIYKGKMIVFDAKETTQERWPIKNIRPHQYAYLQMHSYHGAIAFLLVAFWLPGKNEPEVYILKIEQLKTWVENPKQGRGTQSIPLSYFRENCVRVRSEDGYAVDYLKALNLTGENGFWGTIEQEVR